MNKLPSKQSLRLFRHCITIAIISLLCFLWITHCSPPKYGYGLSGEFKNINIAYTQRMLRHFPIGSDEEDLINFLINEEFEVFPPKENLGQGEKYYRYANFKRMSMPCVTEWHIHWNSNNKKITDMLARKTTACW